jgi:membrane-associated protease RseP (regulator of RpoE activity)
VQLLGILAFVAALLISVTLHEAGHFLTARHYGMKATQFFAGFGPTVWSRQRGETEYGLKAIPLGGYVKIIGMTPLEEVAPGDESRAFFRHKPLSKFVVLVAGSTMHFIICFILVFAAVAAIGVPDQNAPVLTRSSDCLFTSITAAQIDNPNSHLDATPNANGTCPANTVPGRAKAAGFQAGDRVLSVDGTKVTTYLAFAKIVRANAGKALHVTVLRHGTQQALTVTPVTTSRPSLDNKAQQVDVGTIGIGQDTSVIRDVGFVGAFAETPKQIGTMVKGTYDTLVHKLGTIGGIYGPNRDPSGFIGIYGASRISGEVFAAPVPFKYTALGFLFLVASLNLFVGIFNLLPLLPLDGGHIAVVFFEAVRDRIKRARGYVGEVVRVDYNKLMPLTFAVVAVFIGFTVWVLGADIVNPIKLGG